MEKVLLIKTYYHEDIREVNQDIDEMKGLIATANGEVVDVIVQRKRDISPANYIGLGKAEEIAEKYKETIDVVVLDADLKPVQVRNLEDTIGKRIVDRTQLILDIFAARARTGEGKLQVEYAQLNYLLPRISGHGEEMMQQTGGIGARGPGETKLESDKRKINKRIQKIKKELEEVRVKRDLQRERRRSLPVPQIAIVGYTNAGKTQLLNSLTKAGMLSEDKLFATLDPTIRQYMLPNRYKVLFSDTVGFIKNLPTHLVAAFRATLEEVKQADIIIHLIDASVDGFEARRQVVYGILNELGAYEGKLIIEVYNKIDLLTYSKREKFERENKGIFISAKTGEGIDALLKELEKAVETDFVEKKIKVPSGAGKIMQVFYDEGVVVSREDKGDGVYLTVRCMQKTLDKYKKMLKEEKKTNG
jgi:GTP-binding protein HflX